MVRVYEFVRLPAKGLIEEGIPTVTWYCIKELNCDLGPGLKAKAYKSGPTSVVTSVVTKWLKKRQPKVVNYKAPYY